jgi:hypothetical protein
MLGIILDFFFFYSKFNDDVKAILYYIVSDLVISYDELEQAKKKNLMNNS